MDRLGREVAAEGNSSFNRNEPEAARRFVLVACKLAAAGCRWSSWRSPPLPHTHTSPPPPLPQLHPLLRLLLSHRASVCVFFSHLYFFLLRGGRNDPSTRAMTQVSSTRPGLTGEQRVTPGFTAG